MISNYNDLIRQELCDAIDKKNIIDYFYNLNYEDQTKIIKLVLSDYYKVSYYYNREVPSFFENSIDNIVDECINDFNLFLELLNNVIVFNNLDYISKCLILEQLEEDKQDSKIYSFYKFHVVDKLSYKVVDDLEEYKKYYKDYLEKNQLKENRIASITEYICYRMKFLSFDDYNLYQKYILNCIRTYYKWKKFIGSHDGEYLLNRQDFIYLNKIENKKIRELMNDINNDFEFLFTIVAEYLYYETQNLEIKTEYVNSFFENCLDSDIKKKLKII